MAKIKYQELALRTKAVATIEQANAIIGEYSAQGYSLTLRQLYYQFVARGLIPNTQREYARLSVVISNGRRAGLIDWKAIVDRTRFLREVATWSSPQSIINSALAGYKNDLWEDQKYYVEVWFEKDALLGVFERAAELHRLPLFSNRGYVSDSSVWEAAQRILAAHERGKQCVVLHFGDHDPSGLDMTRDVEDRLTLFGAHVRIKRLALNMNQVRKHNPPPNPAKESDSRFAEYKAEHGDKSWELDALPPDVLVQLVNKELAKHIDKASWVAALEQEDLGRRQLDKVSRNWTKIVKRFKV